MIDSVPESDTVSSGEPSPNDAVLCVEDLVVEFPVGRRKLHAVSGVTFQVGEGETLGIVGESGCGKSSTGRAIMQLPRPTSGKVIFEGRDLVAIGQKDLRDVRPRLQMIFQDPISSLNPRQRVSDIVGGPIDNHGLPSGVSVTKASRDDRVATFLETVGLDPASTMSRRPHEFSGGQCQRINIARALILEPRLVICDEPVSALDVSIQAQIINLLEDMKNRYGLSLLFISHDLAVVKNVSDRVAVMYLGKLVEVAGADEIYSRPMHPYTVALLAAVPEPDPDRPPSPEIGLRGDLPSPIDPPSGCRFRTRCPYVQDLCSEQEPPLVQVTPGHRVACHFPMGK